MKIAEYLNGNNYPGRGIIIGRSADGAKALIAYFIMGRSENSRNRVFVEEGNGIRTQAADPAKLTDPSLIIYAPVRVLGNKTIVTNGDQTDTIFDGLNDQKTFELSLRTREFEPDCPNYTPRISGVLRYDGAGSEFSYALSILKSANGNPAQCRRFTFSFGNALDGQGHFIHTYQGDGNPLPSFFGEPAELEMPNTTKEFSDEVWNSLDEANRVSLFIRAIDLATGKTETIITNKYTAQ